jgi:hypothetical protein
MNATETVESMNRMVSDNVAAMRKLAELNTDLWSKLTAKQLELFRMYFETTARLFEVEKGASRADELVAKQMEVAREYGQSAMRVNREIFELFSGSRDSYEAWLDETMHQAKEQVAKSAEVSKTTRKAA